MFQAILLRLTLYSKPESLVIKYFQGWLFIYQYNRRVNQKKEIYCIKYCCSVGVDLQIECAKHTTKGLAIQAKSRKTDCSHLTLNPPNAQTDH